MPIVGISISRLEGARKAIELKGEINLTSTHTITDIREEDNLILAKKILAVDFTLTTQYKPDAGAISLTGQILYLASDADKKEILKQWKTKKLSDIFGAEIVTAIYRKSLLLAATLATELQLPPPVVIPMPTQQAQSVQAAPKTKPATNN